MTLTQQENSVTYAGFWIRVLAYVIDALLLALLSFIFDLLFNSLAQEMQMSVMAGHSASLLAVLLPFSMSIAMALFYLLYEIILTSSSMQGTIGKRVLGLKVVDENYQRISIGRSVGRYFSKFISAILLFIGYIMVAFNDEKRGLHDKMAKTFVVKGDSLPDMMPINTENFLREKDVNEQAIPTSDISSPSKTSSDDEFERIN